MDKEAAYDTLINPLMAQIIAICKEHKIAMFASFTLNNDGLQCTTSLLSDDHEPSDALLRAHRALMGGPPMKLPTTNAQGKIVNMEVIF